MKDLSDAAEWEMKLPHLGSAHDLDVVSDVQKALPVPCVVVACAPRAVLDIYLDTEDMALLDSGTTLRLRRLNSVMNERRGFSLTWKEDLASSEPLLLGRREVRARVKDAELGDLHFERMKCRPIAHALAHLERTTRGPRRGAVGDGASDRLVPTVRLDTFRRTYFFQSLDGTNLLYLMFDSCAATALAPRDAELLLRRGAVFLDPSLPSEVHGFDEAELELPSDAPAEVGDIFREVVRAVGASAPVTYRSKYATAVAGLGLSA